MVKYILVERMNIMRNIMQKIYMFMQGRYGNDQLNNFLLVIWFIIYFVNLFVRSWILFALGLLIIALSMYRTLSKNITKRIAENQKFLPIYNKCKNFFSIQFKRIKEFKTSSYVKCPACKAQLRVKRRKGVHTILCPKCRKEFKKRIWF